MMVPKWPCHKIIVAQLDVWLMSTNAECKALAPVRYGADQYSDSNRQEARFDFGYEVIDIKYLSPLISIR